MSLKALPLAIFLALPLATGARAFVSQSGPASLWTAPVKAPPKGPALKDTTLPAMARLTLRDVVVARYAEEPASSGMFHFFRKMTVVDKQLTDRELYIPWLSRDEALPKVGAHCDIRYHMGQVGGGGLLKPETTETTSDSRIMDDFVCKPVGKT
jgi:hypothetical protein